jgi:hypothetical protein
VSPAAAAPISAARCGLLALLLSIVATPFAAAAAESSTVNEELNSAAVRVRAIG